MDSVDKLREWASSGKLYSDTERFVLHFAAEIEAEIAEQYQLLPVDADGVPIRVGDKIEHRGHTGEVWLFGANEIMCTDRVCYPIGECHIVKPRTLEDVLVDMLEDAIGYSDAHTDVSLVAVEKYADEIRELLGGDAE